MLLKEVEGVKVSAKTARVILSDDDFPAFKEGAR